MYKAVIRFEERYTDKNYPYTVVVAEIDNGTKKVDVLLGYTELAKKIALELLK